MSKITVGESKTPLKKSIRLARNFMRVLKQMDDEKDARNDTHRGAARKPSD